MARVAAERETELIERVRIAERAVELVEQARIAEQIARDETEVRVVRVAMARVTALARGIEVERTSELVRGTVAERIERDPEAARVTEVARDVETTRVVPIAGETDVVMGVTGPIAGLDQITPTADRVETPQETHRLALHRANYFEWVTDLRIATFD